ncbi:MAG: response regulator [Dissulfurispiraceae bacterium]|jgi:YesN/AraC family two-component response regulator
MENGVLEVTVLYVEDDPHARKTVTEILKRVIRTVYTAENGKDGLEAFKQHNPDIVITDIRMPVMSGLDMARKIREGNSTKQIIVTTAHSDTDYFLAAIDIAVDQYVLKPVQSDRLIAAVRKCADFVLNEIKMQKHNEEREKLILDLQDALAKVKTLSGMLPICASCKKIRDDKGYWNQIEAYISEHSEALFTHAICPECAKKLYPEYYDKIWGKEDKPGS